MGPCHKDMHGTSELVDGGDGLQLQRVAGNVLDKKLQTADKGWSFILGGVQGNSNL